MSTPQREEFGMCGSLLAAHAQTEDSSVYVPEDILTKPTRVRREVLPLSLGPTRSMDGKRVNPAGRWMKKWMKMGRVKTSKIPTTSPSGDGLSIASAHSASLDISTAGASLVGA